MSIFPTIPLCQGGKEVRVPLSPVFISLITNLVLFRLSHLVFPTVSLCPIAGKEVRVPLSRVIISLAELPPDYIHLHGNYARLQHDTLAKLQAEINRLVQCGLLLTSTNLGGFDFYYLLLSRLEQVLVVQGGCGWGNAVGEFLDADGFGLVRKLTQRAPPEYAGERARLRAHTSGTRVLSRSYFSRLSWLCSFLRSCISTICWSVGLLVCWAVRLLVHTHGSAYLVIWLSKYLVNTVVVTSPRSADPNRASETSGPSPNCSSKSTVAPSKKVLHCVSL